jgi:LDH2 family malate/lactate/ureidoglycolate dehydrogenase
MSARILQFPAPGRRIVRVERDRSGGEWLVIHGDNAWPCPSRAKALREATELAAQCGAAMVAEAEA